MPCYAIREGEAQEGEEAQEEAEAERQQQQEQQQLAMSSDERPRMRQPSSRGERTSPCATATVQRARRAAVRNELVRRSLFCAVPLWLVPTARRNPVIFLAAIATMIRFFTGGLLYIDHAAPGGEDLERAPPPVLVALVDRELVDARA